MHFVCLLYTSCDFRMGKMGWLLWIKPRPLFRNLKFTPCVLRQFPDTGNLGVPPCLRCTFGESPKQRTLNTCEILLTMECVHLHNKICLPAEEHRGHQKCHGKRDINDTYIWIHIWNIWKIHAKLFHNMNFPWIYWKSHILMDFKIICTNINF